ncbi:MAG TPA: TRAP transporter substrate-binding protein DctP [Myxococcales bacterium]|nr:TRAP transporter substrate-binding protein DctP [Myxococcales bacterium]
MKRLAPFLAALLAPLTARATVLIKLGTVAPQGSPYEQILEDMGHKWAEASGGTVKLRIYPGGVAGNEGDMVRKIGVGQLQAASLTTVGIHDITPEPQALDVPGLIRTPAELDYVLDHIRGQLEQALSAKGFVALTWADAGMVRFFSTFPMPSPADTRKGKIWTWQGDPAAAEGWQAIGFEPVVLSSTDIIPSLQTGMINVVSEPPLYAFASRTFDKANHMLDLDWSLLTGATVVRKETWDRIPPDVQAKLKAISDQAGKDLSAKVQQMNLDAIDQMKQQGLIVDEPTSVAAWRKLAENAWSTVRGKVVPAALFDQIQQLVQEYRASHGQ